MVHDPKWSESLDRTIQVDSPLQGIWVSWSNLLSGARVNFFWFCSVLVGIFDGKQIGPWPWAPWLTSFVTPTFFGFLVGPSRTNRRIDGSLGGLLVEKCKFLQVSSLFWVATNLVAHLCSSISMCSFVLSQSIFLLPEWSPVAQFVGCAPRQSDQQFTSYCYHFPFLSFHNIQRGRHLYLCDFVWFMRIEAGKSHFQMYTKAEKLCVICIGSFNTTAMTDTSLDACRNPAAKVCAWINASFQLSNSLMSTWVFLFL